MSKKQKPPDKLLINQYKSGNTEVLPELVKRWHKIFCEKAYWVTKNKESAKDVAQESWLTIISKIHTLKNPERFKSWAFRIVYTKAIDFVKRRNSANAKLKNVVIEEPENESIVNDRANIRIALLKAIQQLSEDKQVVIRLFYMEEYSIHEISEFLNIPKGTVKSRLFKTREKLKSILKNISYEK